MSQVDPRPRFVVLGASNVSHSIATITALARGSHTQPIEIGSQTEPIEILAAHGRGRSFVGWSRAFFVRDLPGIGECGLWPVLSARSAPTTALVCDAGNDLVYGASPRKIAECVARDLGALERAGARTVLMRLPLDSLRTLGHARFRIIQRIIFPGRQQMERDAMLDAACELDALMQTAAASHGAVLVTPRLSWYGFDPIHVLRARRREAWSEVLSPLWPEVRSRAWDHGDRRVLLRSRPEVRKLFGREQRAAQPDARFADGTTLAWY